VGGIAYHYISDTYVALFSRFIPCGVWEAVHLIEGLLENKSDIQPSTIHADTQGHLTTWTPRDPTGGAGWRRGPSAGAITGVSMRVDKQRGDDGVVRVRLLDEHGEPVGVETLALNAAAHGWDREIERHRCTSQRIEKLLADLGEPLDNPGGTPENDDAENRAGRLPPR